MAKPIFNEIYGIDVPTLILERLDFSKIDIIREAKNIEYTENMGTPTLSFEVYKSTNETLNQNWDAINNYNAIYIPEYDEHFSMHVNVSDDHATYKTVDCELLSKYELQNTKLRNIEINTEDDIARPDYDADYPTIFCRDLRPYPIGSDMYNKLKNASLLHRILDKAPNYSIGHVDTSLLNLKTWFQYSISESDIYGELTGEIAEDYQCLFQFHSATRTIDVYDLCNTCHTCGYRGEFYDKCPECGSTDFSGAYGKDTTIYISKDNLSTSASIESNKDNLKNCFYVAGGDDLMTSAVALANPNGSNYFFHFSQEMFENMPQNLVDRIKSYNQIYDDRLYAKSYSISSSIVNNYNVVVDYINLHYPAYDLNDNKINRYNKISSTVTGYKNIASICYDCIDLTLDLQSAMGKTIRMDNKTIQETMAMLNDKNLSPVAVSSKPENAVKTIVDNTIIGVCKSLINTALYKVEIFESSYNTASYMWTGKFKLTSIEDKSVTLVGGNVSVKVNNEMESYLKQNIQRELNKLDTNYKNLRKMDILIGDFKKELEYYSFDYLSGLKDSYCECLSIILDSKNPDLKNKYNGWYLERINAIETAMASRQKQIDAITALYDYENQKGVIYTIQQSLKSELDFESYLGKDLWNIFCSYRMEDSYKNDNYISDGLDNSQLLSRANELIDMAKKELYKASHVQYTVNSTINNLLILPEFQSITDDFEVGNWVHMCVDEQVYHLRLLSYHIYFDEAEKIEVEFSTVEKIWSGVSDIDDVIQSAQSMAGSYSNTQQKIKNNAAYSKYVEHWIEKSFDATTTKIVNNADNQTVVYDSTGILCRRYDDLTDSYDGCYTRLLNSGIYVTDNDGKSYKAAIGKYFFVDPVTDKETVAMGVLAETLIGKFILGEHLGIYNASGSLQFDANGLTITNGINTFRVDPNNPDRLMSITNNGANIFYLDDNGNLNMKGIIHATGGEISGNIACTGEISGGTISGATLKGGSINISDKFKVDSKGNVTLPAGTALRWEDVTDLDKHVEEKGYQTKDQVTKITKDTVTTTYVNALKVKADSVDAENITGTTITGKNFKSGSIDIGNGNFFVDSNGNLTSKGTMNLGNGKLIYNATGLEIDAKITANSGKIGGFTITEHKIKGGSGADGDRTIVMQSSTETNTYAFAVGGKSHESYADCPFRVTKEGKLHVDNADIRGSIKATTFTAYGKKESTETKIGDNILIKNNDENDAETGLFIGISDSCHNVSSKFKYDGLYFYAFKDFKTERAKLTVNGDFLSSSIGFYAGGSIRCHDSMHVGNEESNPKILFEKSRGLLCFWKNDDPLNLADRAEHYLIYRATDGITAHVGWSGGNLVLNGKTTKALDVSGITVTSDERLKNSFKSLDAFDDVFMDLDSVAFKYNNGTSGRFHFGFKAQNVRDSFLHHGFSTKDFGGFVQMSDSPNDEEYCGVEDPMGLIYTEFTAWNTHMIQKTIKENESLKSRISALEDKIELLLKQAAG